jgi:hypothetical protein
MTTKSRTGAAAEAGEHEVYQRPQLKGPDEIHATGQTGKTIVLKLSRLEYLLEKQIITPQQCDAGLWVAEAWAAYFTPAVTSGIDTHAPGSIPADPLARWAKGQTGFVVTKKGQVVRRDPPPTFRPRKPSDGRFSHDGWSIGRCNALNRWRRANRMLHALPDFQRQMVVCVAIEGASISDALRQITGASKGGKQVDAARRALQSALSELASELEPGIREIAA